jgi:hypothetical protein
MGLEAASPQQPFCILHSLQLRRNVPLLPPTSVPCVVLPPPAVVPSRLTAASVPVLPPTPLRPVVLPRPTVVPSRMCGAQAESHDELDLLSDRDDESSRLPVSSVLVSIWSSSCLNVLPGSSPAGVSSKVVWTAEEEEELRRGVDVGACIDSYVALLSLVPCTRCDCG